MILAPAVAETFTGDFDMSKPNVESADFQHEAAADEHAQHECLMAELEADAQYAEHMARLDAERNAAQAEYDARCRDESGRVLPAPDVAATLASYNAGVITMVGALMTRKA